MLWVARYRDNPRHTLGRCVSSGLLRGVNLGRRQLKMADLRTAVEALGHTDVETYLQSGNVVFTPAKGARQGPRVGDHDGARRDGRHGRATC